MESVACVRVRPAADFVRVCRVSDYVGVRRVRYAYADWPAVMLRSADGGLPARIFDINVTSST